MKTFTLTNDFHGTSARVHVAAAPGIGYELSRHQVRRIRRALCPSRDNCLCGESPLNVRGPQADARVEQVTWNATKPVYVLHERA